MSRHAQSPQESHSHTALRPSTSLSESSDQSQSPLPSVRGLLEVSRCQGVITTAGYESPLGPRPSHAQVLEPCASTCPLEKFALSSRLSSGASCPQHDSLEKPFSIFALGVNPTKQPQALPHDFRNASYESNRPPNTPTTTPHFIPFHHHPLRNVSASVQSGSRPGHVSSTLMDTAAGLPDSTKGQKGFGRNQQRYILPQTPYAYYPPDRSMLDQTTPDAQACRTSYHAPDLYQQPNTADHSLSLDSNTTAKLPKRAVIKATHSQNMSMEEKPSRTIPLINFEVIPPSSPNKRERHLEIAQRSRQRRKERENPLTGSFKRHNSREHGFAMHLDHYRSERDFFRKLVNENHISFPPRPPSPSRVWHHRNAAAMTSAAATPTSSRQSESKEHGATSAEQGRNQGEMPIVINLATTPPGSFTPQPRSVPTSNPALQQDTTCPMLSEYFSRPIKRESVEGEDDNQMRF